MRLKYFCILGIVFFCLAAWLPKSFASSDTIKWYSYEEGIAKGKTEQKKIFIFFYTDWCGYCTKMKKTTLKETSVVTCLDENFISIMVNTDKQKKVGADFGVRGLPTSWFMSEDGEKITNLPGYIPADRFLKVLKFINTDSYKKMTFKKFVEGTK